jgi:hypothetical protein
MDPAGNTCPAQHHEQNILSFYWNTKQYVSDSECKYQVRLFAAVPGTSSGRGFAAAVDEPVQSREIKHRGRGLVDLTGTRCW